MKTREREAAIELRRRDGMSVKSIAAHLGVSRASVSVWVRDVELTEEQKDALLGAAVNGERLSKGRAVASANRRAERLAAQQHGRQLARHGDPLHAAGCMLYWAEGAKRRNDARLTNSDPDVVRFFVEFVRRYFRVPSKEFRVWCNLFADHAARQDEIEGFWLDTLGLSRDSLTKSSVNRYSKYSQKKRQNKLPYGTCRVSVCRTFVVQSIYGSIQEYAGIDRPEWLD